jgi:calmodulin
MNFAPAHQSTESIKKNSKGCVLVTSEELQIAFDFLDVEKHGKITLGNLRKRLSIFFPDLPLKELKFLMNNSKELTLEDLSALLVDNEITNFDPTMEAFKVLTSPVSHFNHFLT